MVLFVSYTAALGGAERLLVDLAAGCGREPVIACPPGPLAHAARARGVRTFPLRVRPLHLRGGVRTRLAAAAHLGRHAREIARLVGDLEPELVVTWGMRPLLAAAITTLPAPLAHQQNDLVPAGLLGAAVRLAARKATLVLAPSHAAARGLARAQVIAPGVDATRFASVPAPPAAGAELLVLGALTRVKRPELALDVLAAVRAQRANARLRYAGAPLPGDGPWLLDALQRRASALGIADAVTFAGEVSDVAGALAEASVLLHCGEREAFGLVVLEALAAGRPVVVPDAGGTAEIVTPECGVRYPPGDARAAAAAAAGLLADPARAARMGEAGRTRARAAYDSARQRARVHAAYASAARGAAPAATASSGIAIVTVTHNSAAELSALLTSIDRHLPGARVVVADAGSSDDSCAVAAARADTELLRFENIGFGRACNRALHAVQAPVTALLNPDVELIDASLLALAAALVDRSAPARLLAPLLLRGDGSRQDSVHPRPLSAAAAAFALIPPAVLPGRLGAALAPWRSRRPRQVGWALGAALVASTETLRALGPFSEHIFLLGEDLELGLRAARAGVETWFCPAARVVHHGDHAIGRAHGGEPFAWRARARHDAIALVHGRTGAALDDVLQAVTFAERLALKRAVGRSAARERRQLAALTAMRRAGSDA